MSYRIVIDGNYEWSELVLAWQSTANLLSGQAHDWEVGERISLPDRNYGEALSFEQHFSRPDGSLTIRAESDEVGNPRDGWGYSCSVVLTVDTPNGQVQMSTSQGSYEPKLRWHELVFSGAVQHSLMKTIEDELRRVLTARPA